ncbi:MAG: 3'-5' exonuclease [Deltaproteobacteria bacterium]|nr:3'-5' exonuclease [Deltaproteobacteria bacterium]
MLKEFVAFDVETTGLSPLQGHRVVEIGAVRMNSGMITSEFHSLIDCGRTIPKAIQRITGINDDMLCGQPSPDVVFKGFQRFIGKAVLVAHNARFDRSFLRYEFNRLGWTLSNRTRCTLALSRRKLPRLSNHRLATVARHLFGELPAGVQLHRALDDARLAGKIWMALNNK